MREKFSHTIAFLTAIFFIVAGAAGCGSKDDKAATTAKPVMAPMPAIGYMPEKGTNVMEPAITAGTPVETGIAVEVDGDKMTRKELDKEIEEKITLVKGQIPAENLEQAKMEIRKGLVDEFVTRTLLSREVGKRKIVATEKEVGEVLDEMKRQLPAGTTMDELLKKNKIDGNQMREQIGLNIRINKLIMQELGGNAAVTEKEITEFYNKNIDKFRQPESVHARHILVAKTSGDSEVVKGGKKAKAEELRKKLIGGADFADLASKHSDCPSKEKGGDLGFFTRGQMVKPFEDATFSLKIKEIGPVVETDFGYHIIQVMERRGAQVAKLDGERKKQISAFLERQKQQGAFDGLLKKLKAGANIVIYGK